MPLNQAIKYIEYTRIGSRDSKFIMNDFLAVFQNNEGTDWFMAPKTYTRELSKKYHIHIRRETPEPRKEFFAGIEKQMYKGESRNV